MAITMSRIYWWFQTGDVKWACSFLRIHLISMTDYMKCDNNNTNCPKPPLSIHLFSTSCSVNFFFFFCQHWAALALIAPPLPLIHLGSPISFEEPPADSVINSPPCGDALNKMCSSLPVPWRWWSHTRRVLGSTHFPGESHHTHSCTNMDNTRICSHSPLPASPPFNDWACFKFLDRMH